MSNRVLKRPMFRRGGMANQGIMTGLEDRSGYQDGELVTQPVTEDKGIFTKIFEFLNPTSGEVIERMQKVKEAPPLTDIFTKPSGEIEFRTQAEALEYMKNNPDYKGKLKIRESGEEIDLGAISEATTEQGTGIFGKDTGGSTVNTATGEPESAADQMKSVYEDILPLLQSTLGVDDSELNRQRYLELAKFGANLMAQPGGSLTRAIGAAAQDPIEGLTRIAETKRQGKRKPAEIAISAAMDIYKDKINNPTAQKIKTIARLGNVSEEEVAKSLLVSTGEQQIKADTTKYLLDGASQRLGLNGPEGLNYASQITRLIDKGFTSIAGKFTETRPEAEDLGQEEIGNYYVDLNGDLLRWNGKTFLTLEDAGFVDQKKK
mgnify:FL=1|jgi:hypothetical protein